MAANKKASFGVEVLLMLILVVTVSAVLLFLIKSDVISVKAGDVEKPILNTEFIPLGREGSIAVTDFFFCRYVDRNYNCIQTLDRFPVGAVVYFKFIVESTTSNNQVVIVENYQLKDPNGLIILDVDGRNDFYFEEESRKEIEDITFKDYFATDFSFKEGMYTLELHIENPLLAKTAKIIKQFELYRK